MNYNNEMAELFDELGLEYELQALKPEEKADAAAWIELENRIALRVYENEAMLAKSEMNAARSALC